MPSPQMEARSRNLGFGFPGYDGCFPKATRSSRGRGDHAKKSFEATELPKEMCFFELLATVAGQLLQEQNEEALPARSLIDLEAPKTNVERILEGSDADDIASDHSKGSESTLAKRGDKIKADQDLKRTTYKTDASYEPSAISCLENLDSTTAQEQYQEPDMQPVKSYSSRKRRNSCTFACQPPPRMASIENRIKTQRGDKIFPKCTSNAETDIQHNVLTLCSIDVKESISPNKRVGHVEKPVDSRQCQDIDLLMHAPFQVDVESPPLVSSGSSEETTFPMEPKPYSTIAFESSRKDGGREEFSCWKPGDDDGNSSESTIAKNLHAKSSSMSYIRAVKSRRWVNSSAKKSCPAMGSKRRRHENEDGVKGQGDGGNSGERAQFGRKKANKLPSLKNDVEQINVTPLGMMVDSKCEDKVHLSPTKFQRAKKISSPSPSPITSLPEEMEDSNVKLSIKSFIVPELMVDIPESATVANLKKAVMEAAMNLLGGGLCVRVLLQGKKVIDETESLLQAGISSSEKLDSLGFMLEPHPVPPSTSVDDTFLVLSRSASQTPSRYPVLSKGSEANTGSFHAGGCEGLIEIDANSSGTETQSTTVSPSTERPLAHDSNGLVMPGSCALVLHSGQKNYGSKGLAVVPFGHGPINKRRIRRPFSVAEVEVLLQAVEKLGTGRWRDVKLHAFPQAKHRTYVDLKDKWKTLVHTASIAPHQRRGEPVPQVLLDRVIQAHSYWTAQQAKQQSMETKVF